MQRLSVKPTLRGWWDYLIQRKYGEIYQCGDVEVHIEREHTYSPYRLLADGGCMVFLANGRPLTALLYCHIPTIIISIFFYIGICRGTFPGLTTRKELHRREGAVTPLRDRENYFRLLLCVQPILRTERENEYAVFTNSKLKWWSSFGLMRFGMLAVFLLLEELATYPLTHGKWLFGLPDKYLLLFAIVSDVVFMSLLALEHWFELKLPARCWERAYLARPRKTIGEVDDFSLPV